MYPKFVNMLKFLMTLLIVKLYFSNHPKCQAYSAACKKWSFREIETEEILQAQIWCSRKVITNILSAHRKI